MIRLKKSEPVRYNGIHYDFTGLDQHKLQNIYDNHPLLRHLFEIIVEETVEFIEDKLSDFLTRNKPEGKTEEEFFNETMDEMKKPIRKRIKRK